jgi:hypothetical protein
LVERVAPVDDDLTWEIRLRYVPERVVVEVWREGEIYAAMSRDVSSGEFYMMNLPDRVMGAATRLFGV